MRSLLTGICFLMVTAACASSATLDFSTTDLGGGLFRYDITLNNPFSQLVSGLNLINANSLFGIDALSAIKSPPGWDFFAPIPGLVDELNFFSLDHASDVPVGGSVSGFGFESFTDPSRLGALRFDLISGSTFRQIPEPHGIFLGGSTLVLIGLLRNLRGYRRGRTVPDRKPY